MSLVVSAPGKVLIAGGYLLLDPNCSGVAVSTSSRFYTVVREHPQVDSEPLIQVRSPQFIDGQWEATVHEDDDGQTLLKDTDSTNPLSKNKSVFLTIQNVLQLAVVMNGNAAIDSILSRGLRITIVGDNDFYSQRAQLASRGLPSTIDSLGKLPAFAPANVKLEDVHKTGLGSSAALITSLVTALLVHFSVITPASLSSDTSKGRVFAHQVAEYFHSLVQGKVDSIFDVSSAVYGSQIYKRYDPEVIESLMGGNENPIPVLLGFSPSNSEYSHEAQPFRLPSRMHLMLADVDAGSDIPSLVEKVLQWRHEKPSEAHTTWDTLYVLIQELASVLAALAAQEIENRTSYDTVLDAVSELPFSEWGSLGSTEPEKFVISKLIQSRTVAEDIRKYMRQMGALSGAPIESPEQTRLLDACIAQSGVIAGGVPGAGGYDAIWLLVLEPRVHSSITPVSAVENVWASWKELDVSPLSATESRERGVRLERLDSVRGLLEVLD